MPATRGKHRKQQHHAFESGFFNSYSTQILLFASLFVLTDYYSSKKEKKTIKIAYKHRIFSKSCPKSSLIIFCNMNKLTFKSARIYFYIEVSGICPMSSGANEI